MIVTETERFTHGVQKHHGHQKDRFGFGAFNVRKTQLTVPQLLVGASDRYVRWSTCSDPISLFLFEPQTSSDKEPNFYISCVSGNIDGVKWLFTELI